MTQDYWRWPESTWTSKDIDWKNSSTITAGVDIGSNSTQAVVMCDNSLFGYANLRTGPDYRESAGQAMKQALGKSGMTIRDIKYTVATGWGSRNVAFAQKIVDEVNCHARGARFIYGSSVKTVVDLGAQTCKAIRLYDWGRVSDFMMNDKCATGMGRGIEVMADLLQVPIQEMGERSLTVGKDPEPVSTTCYDFANTEAIGLFREGYKENEVLAAYLFAIAWRIHGTVGKVNPEKELAFTGGLAKNAGIVKRLERDMKMTALTSEYDPQLAGAIGAALIARDTVEKD
ncbi:MAG: benzoyl-CoA reductase [Chloroflexi bacterium RBG_16_56_11]|nr:MAG: benzoyl-CoA reductase [Chloroflexi bacterium RBG_16_56_11]